MIATTADGGLEWRDAARPRIGPWWKLFGVEPGRIDVETAYASVEGRFFGAIAWRR